ncbi:hypothetical protein [Bacillus sp. SA1-12]|uniref:hypothetical protein n=1 Tax=Bacillus sp. SA1-12 TaxID=1455638 RepID=UPI000B0AA72E|nr:hypothetical protein [Bacillus sp. SA1-12]
MSIFLFIISFLHHIIAFYFIIVLFMKYSTIKDLTNTQKKLLRKQRKQLQAF